MNVSWVWAWVSFRHCFQSFKIYTQESNCWIMSYIISFWFCSYSLCKAKIQIWSTYFDWSLSPKPLLICIFFLPLSLSFFFFVAALGLCCFCAGFLYLWRAGATLWCSEWASHCSDFSLLRSTGFRCSAFSSCSTWALECRLSSCGALT